MKAKMLTFIIFMPILVFSLSGIVKAADADYTSAENIIKTLYSDNKPGNGKENSWDDKKILSQYFDKELTALFIKDAECQKKTEGICNLDFDPIYDAQDVSNPKVTIKLLSSSPRLAYEVSIKDIEFKRLVYYMHKEEDGWRIEDIVYSKGLSLKKLLSQKED